MNKSILVAVGMLICGVSAFAATTVFTRFIFTSKSGQTWNLPAVSLTMQPQGDKLVVTPAQGEAVTLNLDELASAAFADEDASALKSLNPSGGKVTFYTAQGAMVGGFDSYADARAALAAGVYIVKTESGTFKYLVK